MSLPRAPLILLATYSIVYASTPPNSPVSDEERNGYGAPEVKMGRFVLLWPFATRVVYWTVGLCEVAAILSYNYPRIPYSDRILSALTGSAHSAASIRVTPTLLFGTCVATLGASIRHQCYKTLGRFFTFELSIRKEHQLVTSGPYSIVRHPSYTAMFMSMLGIHACLLGSGSLLEASGILHGDIGKMIVSGVALYNLSFIAFFTNRTIQEDETLRQQFGEQWDRWAQNVRYRLIPYIF